MRADAPGEAVTIPNSGNIFGQNAGCVEMWLWPDGWTITNGASSAGSHFPWGLFLNPGGPYLNRMDLGFVGGGVNWWIVSGGVAQGWGAVSRNPAIMDSASQEWHHLGCVWSTTGIDGGPNTMRLYWDGVLADSTNGAIAAMPAFVPTTLLQIGNVNILTVQFVGRIDNIKWWDYAKTDFSDRFQEGFTPARSTDPHAPDLFDRRQPRVEIFGHDIVCRIKDTPKLQERRTLGSDLLIPNDAQIVVENFDNAFSINNPRSVFSGTNFRGERVQIWDRYNQRIWDGLLEDPIVSHDKKTTTIVSRSRMFKWRMEPVVYTSAAPETPASAFRNIAAAIGFTDFDNAFLTRSETQQTAGGLLLTVTLAASDNETFMNVVNKLADFGCADIYEHLGKLRYVHYVPEPPTPIVNIAECDILDQPGIKVSTAPDPSSDEFINDYAIQYPGGPPVPTVTDAGAGNIGAVSRSRNGVFQNKKVGELDAKYSINDAVAAQYLGECWIRRTHVNLTTRPEPRTRVAIALEVEHRSWIDLTADFRLSYARESWVEKNFRVTDFIRDDRKRTIKIGAVEWPG